jgi:hypothetical protein
MSDIHASSIWTYHSANSEPGKEWLAYLILPTGRLPLAFFATSEDEARTSAQAEWDKHREEREQNHQRREEGRRKAAETKARKSAKP